MKLIYYILYGLINFFILIGDVTRFILTLPYFFVKFLSSYLIRSVTRCVNAVRKLGSQLVIPSLPAVSKKRYTSLKRPVRRRDSYDLSFLKLRYFIYGFLVAGVLSLAYQSYVIVRSLPSPRSIGKVNYSLSTHLYDRNGKLLYEFYREQNRTPIKLRQLQPYVYQATIAIEDKNFFNHNGVSLIGGIGRAFKEFVVSSQVQGGSTITQQLVKTALLTPERTVERKVKEIILALWTERLFTKQQILEMYLNQVAYGGSSYGIEEAAQSYFGKSARALSISEAALLAGLPQAPSVYSPFVNPTYALNRRNDVLTKMYEQRFITKEQYTHARQEKLPSFTQATAIHAPHFVFYVRGELEKKFGIRTVEEGGLNVSTSLDLTIQEQVQTILTEELAKVASLNVTNGGVLVTKPATGEILAMVGSSDYFQEPNGAFNVTTALRQPGSSIKPLMYATALEHGITAATAIDDSPVVFKVSDTESYRPVNYDGKFHGKVTLRSALANSYNIPAVRTLNSIGVDQFIDKASLMGITTWTDRDRYGLSLTLGGGEVTMIDMARAYGVFANIGKRVDTDPFIRVTSLEDKPLYELSSRKIPVLSEGAAYIISDILSDNSARQQAFGPGSQLEIPGYKVAVKTGTTDSKKDNWTIGYTPEFLVVVWVGNNNNTPMDPALASGVTGAAPIWHRVMEYLLTNYGSKNSWFSKPDSVIGKPCYAGKVEYFISGTENSGTCRVTGVPPTQPHQ